MTQVTVTRRTLLGAAGLTAATAMFGMPNYLRAQSSVKTLKILLSTLPADPAFHVYYFAKEQGFYKDVGLDIDIIPAAGDATALRLLLAGEADLASAGALPTLQALVGGTKLKIVSTYNPTLDYLLVATEAVKSGKDLDGQPVAVSQVGSTSHLIAQLLVSKSGGDTSKVSWVSVGASSARVQSLIAKRVSAAPLNSVFAARAAQHMKTNVIGNASRDLPDLVYAWEVATPKLISDDRQSVQSFVTATGRAAQWAAANPSEAAAISLNVLPDQDPTEVTSAITDFAAKKFWGSNGELSRQKWDFTLAAVKSIGVNTAGLEMSDLLLPEFAAEAARQLTNHKG